MGICFLYEYLYAKEADRNFLLKRQNEMAKKKTLRRWGSTKNRIWNSAEMGPKIVEKIEN